MASEMSIAFDARNGEGIERRVCENRRKICQARAGKTARGGDILQCIATTNRFDESTPTEISAPAKFPFAINYEVILARTELLYLVSPATLHRASERASKDEIANEE